MNENERVEMNERDMEAVSREVAEFNRGLSHDFMVMVLTACAILLAIFGFISLVSCLVGCASERETLARARGRADAEAEMVAAGGATAWVHGAVNAWCRANDRAPAYD